MKEREHWSFRGPLAFIVSLLLCVMLIATLSDAQTVAPRQEHKPLVKGPAVGQISKVS